MSTFTTTDDSVRFTDTDGEVSFTSSRPTVTFTAAYQSVTGNGFNAIILGLTDPIPPGTPDDTFVFREAT